MAKMTDKKYPGENDPTAQANPSSLIYNSELSTGAISLLEQVKAKKRMYFSKIAELDAIENELIDSRIEERLESIKVHYTYI